MMRASVSHGRKAAVGLGMALLLGTPWVAQAQSAAHGQKLFETRCTACHSLDANRVGPALGTVVGRKAGTAKDFTYSPALAAATHRWTRPMLLAWLTDPEKVVPGQGMGYRVDNATDREYVVAYLSAQPRPKR
jgi:cytochrome c